MRTRWLSLFITVCVSLAAASSWASSFPDRYDREIKKASKMYLPGIDWRLWKAQLYQESRFDPNAISPVGAAGLAQFMPATWKQISRELNMEGLSPHATEASILAGAYYMAKLRNGWKSERPETDRHKLAAASYNAGMGNMINAQKKCNMRPLYDEIITCLPQVTGRHSKETITYVERIWYWWKLMML